MTTVAEKQASVATFIDDLATSLAGLSDWEDGDTAITNDQSTDGWRDNARVFTHVPTGRYLLFYASNNDGFQSQRYGNNISGIRFVYSDNWDSTNNHPKGNTNAISADPFTTDDTWNDDDGRERTLENSYYRNKSGYGLWVFRTTASPRSDYASNYETNYFLSARNDGVSIGGWSTNQSYGGSGYLSYEHTSGKFWSDGVENFTVMCKNNLRSSANDLVSYGFKYGNARYGDDYEGHPDESGLEKSRWGFINSTSNDDTYFVQYGLLYSEAGQKHPSVYTTDILRNDNDEGGAHGDEISYDGNTYKILKQSGGNYSSPINACIRFE